MAGPSKNRQRKERKNEKDSAKSASPKETSPQDSTSPSDTSPPTTTPPARWDGNRDPAGSSRADNGSVPAINPNGVVAVRAHRNLDLGLAGSFLLTGIPGAIPPRPGYNSTGRPVNLAVNFHIAKALPSKPVHQYDVHIGDGKEKRGLIRKIWQSNKVQSALDSSWIFDGVKIAYSLQKQKEIVLQIDLDVENGKEPSKREEQKKMVIIRHAKQLDMASLQAYLDGQLKNWTNECLEAITFLDHLLREMPSRNMTAIKRNFYHRDQERSLLDESIEAIKGTYASMRPVQGGRNERGRLAINIDVANTAFFRPSKFHLMARIFIGVNSMEDFVWKTLHAKSKEGNYTTQFWEKLNKMRRLRITTDHRGGEADKEEFIIAGFIRENARDCKFDMKIEGDDRGRTQRISVEEYFKKKYDRILRDWQLPVIETTKKQKLPMECCWIVPHQRCAHKLTDRQTSEMIKFAATPPDNRLQSIQKGLKFLNWEQDKFHQAYGLKINKEQEKVTARILPNPKVEFGNSSINPGTTGRWDLRNKKFFHTHPTPLKSWAVAVFPGMGGREAISPQQVQAFIASFINVFQGHGGVIQNKQPSIVKVGVHPGEAVEKCWLAAGNQSKARPQILFFIMGWKELNIYNRIKKSCDCRYGVVSQVMQSAQVAKNQGQYQSNVSMKVHAKLGGSTTRANGISTPGFSKPTMLIGGDVSHGATSNYDSASIAAITMSTDKIGARYMASVESNGQREEMILRDNWFGLFKPMMEAWMKNLGGGRMPQHIIYFRDGVSEGQFAHVLAEEVKDIKAVLKELDPKNTIKLTVVVCSKRHHVRFFPGKDLADPKNGNVPPGTLVETGITHPYEYDFYLCAHSAIKGTARPVHYYVLLDEEKMAVERLQNMIYEHSYQYVRSTTPVSLFPAIYYAHLAANRSNCHINEPSQPGPEDEKGSKRFMKKDPNADVKKLLPMPNQGSIQQAMWFV